MPAGLDLDLDLRLAWRRLRIEPPTKAFTRHPFEMCLAEHDLEGWLSAIAGELGSGRYSPSPILVANVPKGKGAVRPGACMSLKDRLVYTACLGVLLPEIVRTLAWPKAEVDFSYPLTSRYTEPKWIVNEFKAWQRFRDESLRRLTGKAYAVIADITGYYENIDLATLSSDLLATGGPENAIRLIMRCLNKWAQVGGRGIPQGQTPSDILGKLYLNSVDRSLYEAGYDHCRYVDDIRIFCHDYAQAKRALVELSELLRKRGLNIQSAKSAIFRADKAHEEIDGITPVIKSVREKYIADLSRILELEGYTPAAEIERLLVAKPDETPVEVLRDTYKAFFIDADPYKFDKTLFHFLIKRLGSAKDRFAVDHCKTILERQPQETSYALSYFSAVGVAADVEAAISTFIESKEAVYSYQIYQVFEWLVDALVAPTEATINSARQRAFDGHHPPYLRSICRKFLSKYGSLSDLERIEHAYASAGSSLEQAEIMCCLARMEKGRRNAFLARSEGDGEWNARAASWIKAH